MSAKLAILVPAYNEGPRISAVLKVLCSYAYDGIVKVVFIDDGSTDGTAAAAGKYPIELVSLSTNCGNGAALQAGIDYVGKAEYWLFVDADLINLAHSHLNELLGPLLEDREIAMTVGVFRGRRTLTDMAHRFFSILNGHRRIYRKIYRRAALS